MYFIFHLCLCPAVLAFILVIFLCLNILYAPTYQVKFLVREKLLGNKPDSDPDSDVTAFSIYSIIWMISEVVPQQHWQGSDLHSCKHLYCTVNVKISKTKHLTPICTQGQCLVCQKVKRGIPVRNEWRWSYWLFFVSVFHGHSLQLDLRSAWYQ